MSPVLVQMWHNVAVGLGFASIAIAVVALLGTLYALAFAMMGISVSRDKNEDSFATAGRRLPTTNFLVLIPAHNEVRA